jgi:hypothetical protein
MGRDRRTDLALVQRSPLRTQHGAILSSREYEDELKAEDVDGVVA